MTTGPAAAIDAVAVDSAAFASAALLFDAYRVHYGAESAPDRAATWLRAQIAAGRLLGWVARDGSGAVGLITVAPMPASIKLRTNWSIRDLYVSPAERGRGHGEALLRHVINAATVHGAGRIGLQTEVDNRASALYQRPGFGPEHGYVGFGMALDSGS